MQKTLKITEENQIGKRIDKFICNQTNDFTRGEIVKAIKKNNILLNNKKTKPSTLLKLNDEIEIDITKKIKELKPNSKIKLNIIFENNDFYIINKPSGLQVHPSAINENDTLVNALIHLNSELKEIGESWERPGIVHRLDKDTSGVMIVAKNNESFQELKKEFKNKKVQKTYITLVWGKLEKKSSLIDLPIAKTPSHKKQKIAQGKFSGQARSAQTKYKVIEELMFPHKIIDERDAVNLKKLFVKSDTEKNKDKIRASLLEVKPKTGRTHQIRIHLSHLGHPLINDERYYKKIHKTLNSDFVINQHKTFLLHSQKIEFTLNDKKYSFSVPLPDYFEKTLANLRKSN